ncbi:extracellular solute-binding protein [Phyllobacterium sp. SB3]|uniref:ABC transporter substrate-binding protein n=1 Tax=Phyllobacterium sp. SB3 TaxID=3156073 RepID=UPI0032AF5B74
MVLNFTRRQFNLGLAMAASSVPVGSCPALAQTGRVVVGVWGGDYQTISQGNIVDNLIAPTGLQTVFDTANDTVRRTKLLAERRLPRGSMDVVALTAAGSYQMYKNDTLEELDASKLPNLAHVLPSLAKSYAIPQFFSGRVILYNPAFVKTVPTSYNDLWNEEYSGKVGVIDVQYQATLESAALISGGSVSNFEPAKQKLLELKKMGVRIYPTNESMAQALSSGECVICIMWQSRGLSWKKGGVPIEIAYPKEGIGLFISDLAIPKNAPNKDAAYVYLNAALDPVAQRAFAAIQGNAPSIDNAVLSAELAANVALPDDPGLKMLLPDQDYISKNDAQLLDWWNKVFKA